MEPTTTADREAAPDNFIPMTPIISFIQKIVVYETKARFFIVGSNNTETRFRVLKVDRTEPSSLSIVDDGIEYTQKQVRDLLMMIDFGNRNKQTQRGLSGLTMTASAFGIVGFVRFLTGYYMVLITKRRKVALIGPHTVYKIEDTSMIYIPNETVNIQHPDESKYVKMFQNVDLSSNFYYSYSYDLTHTLQYNFAPCRDVDSQLAGNGLGADMTATKSQQHACRVSQHSGTQRSSCNEGEVEDARTAVAGFSSITSSTELEAPPLADVQTNCDSSKTGLHERHVFGVRNEPTRKFVWNNYLLREIDGEVHHDWILYIIHGFMGQCNLNVYGRSLYLTLIARRSNEYAGTRFLKRGANSDGNVANEVETEQIVQDASTLAYDKMRLFTSFVQHRGSVPLYWSQDISKMVPKPPIQMDLLDPYCYASGQHFNRLLKRHGAPIVILNLVKKREKRPHESILIDNFVDCINFLNQFLPPDLSIQYIGFDMARINKSKNANVLARLADVADVVLKKTGFFHTGPLLGKGRSNEGVISEQQGILRTNCVDCLDRTNTAQFVVGKCVLALQLHAMNCLEKPSLEFDTDCVRMLEELYEDHGDTLALQYGGSQLVHRIQTYRKIAPWTSHSRDIMQTLSRYYSNTFSDAEKQHAINLFLGVFTPTEKGPAIWDLSTDYYYHNSAATLKPAVRTKRYSQWWDDDVMESLPRACEEVTKSIAHLQAWFLTDDQDERVNCYWDYYKPYELTTLDELYCLSMTHSVRDFMPKFAADCSPFAVRIRPGRRHEESGLSNFLTLPMGGLSGGSGYKMAFESLSGQKLLPRLVGYLTLMRGVPRFSIEGQLYGKSASKNPSISGNDSSTSLPGSEASTSGSDVSDIEGDFQSLKDDREPFARQLSSAVTLKDIFPTMKQVYGVDVVSPEKRDVIIYKRHAQIGRNATRPLEVNEYNQKVATRGTTIIQSSPFSLDSSYNVTPPTVSKHSREIYRNHVAVGRFGAKQPDKESMDLYRKFVHSKYQ